ncbi:hypothetical protein [Herminiimonas sp. CN]|uniref:hypothetical protein n=1 Tax=Herminiimonas sp. CN TaxID=1349818 RepID=UPI0012DC3E1C|nr:hypothetical protein [Herminiimonas sp. CN]
MKKSNSILQAAVVGALLAMAVGAQAGNLATTTYTFATENFGATQAATVAVTPAAVSYAVSNAGGVTLAIGQTTTLYFRLSGSHVFAAAPVAGDFAGAFTTALGAPTAIAIGAAPNDNTIAVTYTNTTLAAVNLPVNSTEVWTPAAGAVTATSSTLATAGGTIAITGSLSGLAVNTAAAALPADQDPVSAPAVIATSAAAITGAVTSAAAFAIPETARIDLAAVPSASAFANKVNGAAATLVNLGRYVFTNNATVTPTTLAGAPYALGGAAAAAGAVFAGTSVTVSPNGGSFPVGATFALNSALNCAAGTATSAASAAVTAATAATAVVVPATAGNAVPATATPYYVCMTADGVNAIAPVAPTAAVSLTKTVGTDAANTIAATPLYALQYNGSLRDVRSYIPAAAVGYQSFIRVINTGAQTAPITGQFVYADGTLGTAATLIGSLPAAGAVTLTATEVEAALGAPTGGATARPRLRVTGPTTGLNVQSFMSSPAGVFSDMTGAQ